MRLSFRWFAPLALLGVGILAGCTVSTTSQSDSPADTSTPDKALNADRAEKSDMEALVAGNNQVTFDLFRRLDNKDNLFVSPFCVTTAVSMAFANNDGDAMGKALHVPFTQDRLNITYAGLLWKLQGEGRPRPYELTIANAVWLTNSKEFKPSEEYVIKARDNYAAPPHSVDFLTDGVDQVNAWCAQKTRDKIKDILERKDVDAATAAVLTNAIYFKGDWKYQFKKGQTQPGPFHVEANRTVPASMMNQLVEVRYFAGAGAQVLELPYKGDDLSMLVVLPAQRDGLANLERGLSAERLDQWTKELHKRKVRVTLPRFRIVGERLRLRDTLDGLQFPIKTEPKIGTPPPGTVLYIAEVFHRGFVEVNEEGAEASAVTAVVVKWEDKGGEGDDTVTFRADHPFLFLIRDNRTGCVLFIGRVVEPK